MPSQASNETITRQWAMLKRIPSRAPGISAGELTVFLETEGFPVTKRTVERDLASLSRSFALVCEDSQTPYRWYWLSGMGMEFAGLELSEAASLMLVGDHLGTFLPASLIRALEPKFEQARKKIEAHAGHRHARWARKLRFVPQTHPTLPPKVIPAILDTVHECLLDESQLEASYLQPSEKKPKTLTLHPLSLIQHGNTPYLLASAFDYSDHRLYPLHRFQRAKRIDAPARIPKHFSIEQYLNEAGMGFGDRKKIRLEARLSDNLSYLLTETPLSRSQKLSLKTGRWHLEAEVYDTWQLQFWILSQGPEIAVLKPKSLRDRIAGQLAAAAEHYQS